MRSEEPSGYAVERGGGRTREVEQTREHPPCVPIDRRLRDPERDAGNRTGRVGPDPRKSSEPGGIIGKPAPVALDDLPRRAVEISGPRVVSEPLPRLQHLIQIRSRQRLDVREASQEALVEGAHGVQPRLLRHHLGDPYPVGLAAGAPRHIPLAGLEPG